MELASVYAYWARIHESINTICQNVVARGVSLLWLTVVLGQSFINLSPWLSPMKFVVTLPELFMPHAYRTAQRRYCRVRRALPTCWPISARRGDTPGCGARPWLSCLS